MSERRDRSAAPAGARRGVPGRDEPGQPRLFFAIPLPEDARTEIASLAGRVRASVDGVRARWVRFEGLHLTLQFLGPTPVESLPELRAALEDAAAGVPRFELELAGGGAYPSPARPRTLWVGVAAGGEGLAALADALVDDPRVARRLPEAMQEPGGRRPFSPHLTLARTDGVRGAAALARALQREAAGIQVRCSVESVVLYRSLLGSGPARYEALHEARLGD